MEPMEPPLDPPLQHRQHSEPGQTLRQAGNKPESTLTSQVQYRALPIGLWRIISAMQHTSEHKYMQCRNLFKYAAMLHVHNTMLAATIAL